MRIMLVVFLFLALLSRSVGAGGRFHCNRESALRIGGKDAAGWNAGKPGLRRAGRCAEAEGYGTEQYKKDYIEGYNSTLKENCHSK